MKRVAFWLVALLLTAAVLTAVAVTKFPNTSKSDYSANFASSLEGAGWTPIQPISQIADNVYSGSYRASSGNSGGNGSVTLTVTIEIAQSEAAAKEQYGQLVLQKQSDGYTGESSQLGNSTIFGDPQASWYGYETNSSSVNASTYTFLYAHDPEINGWVVVTESANAVSQNFT